MSENSNSNGSNSSWTMVSPEDSAAETESSGDNGIESLSAETVAEFPTSSELESLLPHTEQLSSFEDQLVKKVLLEKGGAESETFEKNLTQEESNVVNIPQSIGCLVEDDEEGEIGQKSGTAQKMANIGKQAGEDLDELSSSGEESGNTVRKRRGTEVKSPTGADFIERGKHEVRVDQEQWWDGLTLNKCIIGALVLLGLGVVLFSDEGLETDELKQEALSQTLDWQNINMEQLQEDPQALQTLTKLLDKLAKENQQIRLMQAQLQMEKEELQTVLEKTEATMQCPELVQKNTQLMQKVQLLPALQEEVEILRQKVTEFNVTGSTSSLLNITLESENRRLAEELKIEKEKTSALLNQKETLVAETLMLRQELDKQRKLLESMRTELEGLVANSNGTYTEGERTVRGTRIRESLMELEKRLALELQHSEKLKDKKYSPHTQLHHDQKKEMKNKVEMAGAGKVHEWKEMGDKDFRKKEGHVEGLLNEKENKWKTKKEEEWKMRKEGEWKTRKERNIKREDEETWKDRKEYNLHKTEHKHVHSQWNKENKPQGEDKGDTHKVKRHWETPGEGAARPDHRHHEHNKFWKNDGERKKHYRAPEGCTGIEECALKEGMEHFKTSLKPVQQQDFGKILGTYLEKVKDQISRQELEKFSDGFFENGVFVHDRMFFRDFVEDVEEMLEDIIERQGGKDDEVEEFDEEVFHHFFGVERGKNRHNMKVKMKKPWQQQQHHNKPHKKQKDGMKKHFYKDKREKYQEDWPHKRKRWEWHGASVSHHPRH